MLAQPQYAKKPINALMGNCHVNMSATILKHERLENPTAPESSLPSQKASQSNVLNQAVKRVSYTTAEVLAL